MDWTDEEEAVLRSLWGEGHSTNEIARRMGVSKNAIAGKAHRLDLEARPSPIRRGAKPSAPPRPRVPKATLPPLEAFVPIVMPVPRPISQIVMPAPRPISQIVLPPPVPPPSPVAVRAPRAGSPCCWPIGEPRTKAFRYCDAPSISGKPYCGDHTRLAGARIQDRGDLA
jgi:GcrA cell cycle regulator